ncbi:MAG: pirin family protein [Candidatus Hodarchaeales archaeon]|jgi:redox-sensitive bicupin YhaK (pirin superfamily)
MGSIRKIQQILKSKPTMEGAGVRLKRVFGFHEVPRLDPFLLLDDFGSENPDDYLAGFPWHPHRGIITVTYMLGGRVRHEDSLGNQGVIHSGDLQWMNAGSGIIHQEMPEQIESSLNGFQLWINLPASHKMMQPSYQDIQDVKVPEIELENGSIIKLIAGKMNGFHGPVNVMFHDTEYLDVQIAPKQTFKHSVKTDYTVLAYILNGEGKLSPNSEKSISNDHLVLYNKTGDQIIIQAGDIPLRFLLISGKPLGEPIAWYGPIVMNTDAELKLAFDEYQAGTFIKHKV